MKVDITYAPYEEREAHLVERFAATLCESAEIRCAADRLADKHCRECVCTSCDVFGTEECLEGADICKKCDHTSHTEYCPWHPDEQ